MDTVYIETSIVSHATAWPSSDPAVSVLQQQARAWWAIERPKFSLVTSQLVLDEASLGDPDAAAERLKLLAGIPLIPTDKRVEEIADELIARSLIPETARLDALHVASAAVGSVQFLLTQNCRLNSWGVSTMTHNPILEELYAIREKLLADAGGDVQKYLAGVRQREAASGRLLKPTSQRTNRSTGAAKSGVLAEGNRSSPPGDR